MRIARILPLAILALPALSLPAWAQHARPSEAELKEAFVLHIRDGGLLQLPSMESITLREFLARIAKAGVEFDERMSAGSRERTDLPLVLHVEDNAPWQHVQTVMRIAVQRRCHRIWLARTGSGSAATRYWNVWVRPKGVTRYVKTATGIEEIPAANFQLFVLPRSERLREWRTTGGVIRLSQPTAASYLFGPEEDAGTLLDAKAFGTAYADRTRIENAGAVVRAIVSAPPRMPSRLVIDAMQAFDRTLYPLVEVLETPLPERDEWYRRRLSFPKRAGPRKRTASVIGGDSQETFLVAPGAVSPGAAPVASREVRAVEGFELIDAGVRMPLAAGLAPDRGPWDKERLTINLTRRGQLRARGHQFSLRGLGAFLRGLAMARKIDTKSTRLRVLLRVDGEAPWRHVQALLTEIRRSGVHHVEFGVRIAATAGDSQRAADRFDVLYRPRDADGSLHDAFFPLPLYELDGALDQPSVLEAIRTVQRSRLDMVAEREVETTWGPKGSTVRVRRPVNVRFVWNGQKYYSIRDVLRSVVAARAASMRGAKFWSKKTLRVVVSASEKVPSKYVIACLARLAGMKWGDIWFFFQLDTSESTRTSMFLPYPETNHPLRAVDGLESIAGADERGRK